jgi:deazaflavin-dependent oxidoreductase (nitroreductase family)
MNALDWTLAWCSGHIPRFTARTHRLIYRTTGGLVGGRLPGYRILWLTTVGWKTGRSRTWPLLYFTDGADIVVLASNNGADTHPGWYLNLQHNPRVSIQIEGTRRSVIATTADPAERQRLWPVALQTFPLYNVVARRTKREIPLVILRAKQVR